MKQLIIGDIHGCYRELQALLDQAELGDEDEIIAIGDLLDRGPKPVEVLNFFRNTPNARSIRGNHEQKHIRANEEELKPALAQLITRWQIGTDYEQALSFMESLPLYIDLPDALLLHGFFEPNVKLEDQHPYMLMGTMGREEYLKKNFERPWYEYYDSEKPLIVGHRDYSMMQKPFIWNDRVYGIDTGCVYGGVLTGLILPDFKLISAPARKNYWFKLRNRYLADG